MKNSYVNDKMMLDNPPPGLKFKLYPDIANDQGTVVLLSQLQPVPYLRIKMKSFNIKTTSQPDDKEHHVKVQINVLKQSPVSIMLCPDRINIEDIVSSGTGEMPAFHDVKGCIWPVDLPCNNKQEAGLIEPQLEIHDQSVQAIVTMEGYDTGREVEGILFVSYVVLT